MCQTQILAPYDIQFNKHNSYLYKTGLYMAEQDTIM